MGRGGVLQLLTRGATRRDESTVICLCDVELQSYIYRVSIGVEPITSIYICRIVVGVESEDEGHGGICFRLDLN